MARTASPSTPGSHDEDHRALAASPVVPEDETPEQTVARMAREMADLRALVHQLGRNQVASSPVKEDLPTMKSVQKDAPTIPVLTEEGWYVPEVHPMDLVLAKKA